MRKPCDIRIGEYTLADILEKHNHWINEDIEGWENMLANLSGVNLSYVDLRDVNLYGANLRGANLRNAYLIGVNLGYVDLSYANLSCVTLCNANLYGADLCGTDLHNANLSDANLSSTNLGDANLYGANLNRATLCNANLHNATLHNVRLRGANLHNATLHNVNLRGTDLIGANLYEVKGDISYRKGKILTEDIIGYKKCIGDVIVTLLIPRGSIVFSINGGKCRTNKAKVIAIDGADRAISTHKHMSYYVGDEFTIYDFNCEYNVECGKGIHFFMTKEEAMNY